MNNQPGVHSNLTRLVGLDGRHIRILLNGGRIATATRCYMRPGGRGRDLYAADISEWFKECPQVGLSVCLGNDQKSMLAIDNGLALDVNPLLTGVAPIENVQELSALVRVLGRACRSIMLMSYNEESHAS
jgi:hypothetical protein